MIKPHALYGKKIALFGKPVKMLPQVRLTTKKVKSLKPGLQFWPQPEENKNDRLPESE
jgi:hypothetical protein